MSAGFITNPTEVVGITSTGYTAILLAEDTTADAKSRAIPQSSLVSHIEIIMVQTALVTAQVRAYISYDATGDQIFAGPSALADVAPGGTVNTLIISISARAYYTAPTAQTTKQKLYLWLRTDVGTVKVEVGKARLQWVQGTNVGL